MIRRYAGLVAIGIALGAGPVIAAEPTKGADCQCINVFQKTILQREKLATCKKVNGAKCLNFEVRITKPWRYDQAKGVCVGSYEYWDTRSDTKPQTYREATYNDMTVDLATARKRCVAVGIAPAPQPAAPQQTQKTQPAPAPKPPTAQQQSQKPQPTTPQSHPPQETHRPPPQPIPPIFPPQKAQVPLTPPPPIPTAPVAPTQQAQVPLTPPPPIPVPPSGPGQQTQKPVDHKERFYRAIEDSLGIAPGMLAMAERIKGNAGFVAYRGPDGSPWVVDTFGIQKPMSDWMRQRVDREESLLLTDKRVSTYVHTSLGIGLDTLAFAHSTDPRITMAGHRQDWESIPGHGFGGKDYVAILATGMQNEHLRSGSMRAPEPPPGTNLTMYYYLWRRAMAVQDHSDPSGLTTWDLVRSLNGGGDFIQRLPNPENAGPRRYARGRMHAPVAPGAAMLASTTAPSEASGRLSRIELTSATADMKEFDGLVEVSGAGVSVIAVMHGSVTLREHATNMTRTAGVGSYIVAVPGVGVVTAPLPDDLRARMAAELKNLPPAPAPGRPAGGASGPARRQLAADTPAISAIAPARGVKDGKPVDPGSVFTPEVNPIYVWFRMAGHDAPTALRGVWHYLGAGKDQVIISSEIIMQANQDWGDFQLELPPGRPWPKGEYRVDILIADKHAVAVPFRIAEAAPQSASKPSAAREAPAAPGASAGITLAGVEALLRELGAQPERKTRKDGVPYFEFTIDGRGTALALYGCTPGPCTQSLLHTGFKTDKKVSLQAINDWNSNQRFVRAYLDADGDPTVESDLAIAGAQMATVREWIATWRQRLPSFVSMLAK